MMENAEKKTAKKPTCKEAFEHRKEFEYKLTVDIYDERING